MSAAEVRKAAETLRERAEAATTGPWHPATTGVESGDHWYVLDYPTMNSVCWMRADDGENEDQRPRDARYIATVHPRVGLALADWLDRTVTDLQATNYGRELTHTEMSALAVARLINRGAS